MANAKRDRLVKELEAEATANGHALIGWTKGRWGFHSQCATCAAHIAFTASTGEIRERESIQENCADRAARIAAYRREAGI
jgi:hypothetical protein